MDVGQILAVTLPSSIMNSSLGTMITGGTGSGVVQKVVLQMLLVLLVSQWSRIRKWLSDMLESWFWTKLKKRLCKSSFILECELYWEQGVLCRVCVTEKYHAVMDLVYHRLTSQSDVKYVATWVSGLRGWQVDFYEALMLDEDVEVRLVKSMGTEEVVNSGGPSKKKICYSLTLTSRTGRSDNITRLIDATVTAYTAETPSQELSIFRRNDEATEAESVYQVHFSDFKFDTKKCFGNMFFAQKQELISRLDMFQEGLDRPCLLGLTWTLGLLLYGEPGTGKTSLIKSIARHTGRHIIMVPTASIKTEQQLFHLFTSPRLGKKTVPMRKRLYVFEEIDCSSWAELVRDRSRVHQEEIAAAAASFGGAGGVVKAAAGSLWKSPAAAPEAPPPPEVTVDTKDKDKDKEKEKEKLKGDPLTLGYILEVLDGMIEMPGRMIVMTSNRPERLDPALIRQGRIDMQINITNMRRQDVADMFQLWFEQALPDACLATMQDWVYSQAQIGNMFGCRDTRRICAALARNKML
jgi:ATPase family associated with various cellular activities (AAA)